MPDRHPLPEQLEQAVQAAKQWPADHELHVQKARTWQKIEEQGQRGWRSAGWLKPLLSVTASALAVLALVVLPGELGWFGGGQVPQSGEQAVQPTEPPMAETAPQSDKEPVVRFWEDERLGARIERRDGAVWLVRDSEEDVKLADVIQGEGSTTYSDDEGHVLLHISRHTTGQMITRLYRIDIQKGTAELVPVQDEVNSVAFWKLGGRTQVVIAVYHPDLKHPPAGVLSYVRFDWESMEFQPLPVPADQPPSLFADGEYLYAYYGQRIHVFDTRTNSWRVAAEVKIPTDPHLQFVGAQGGQMYYVIDSNSELMGKSYYRGKARVMRYDAVSRQTERLLPGLEGDQYVAGTFGDTLVKRTFDSMIIGNFQPTDTGTDAQPEQMPGVLQLWEIKGDEPPKLLYQEETTWEHHFYSKSGQWELGRYDVNGYLLEESPRLEYDAESGSIRRADRK